MQPVQPAFSNAVFVNTPLSHYSWKFDFHDSNEVLEAPVAFGPDEEIYFGTKPLPFTGARCHAYALTRDGNRIFSEELPGRVEGRPALFGDKVCFAGYPGYIIAFSKTGSFLWKYQREDSGSSFDGHLRSSGNTVFALTSSKVLVAVNADNGTLKWEYQAGDAEFSHPLQADQGGVFVIEGSHLLRFNDQGERAIVYNLGSAFASPVFQGENGDFCFATSDKCIFRFSNKGECLASFTVQETPRRVAVAENRLIVSHSRGQVSAFDHHGECFWVYQTESNQTDSLAADDHGDVFISSYPHLIALDSSGGFKWKASATNDEFDISINPRDGSVFLGCIQSVGHNKQSCLAKLRLL